jgi:poly(3-hydroxybutyrate) depolymerase
MACSAAFLFLATASNSQTINVRGKITDAAAKAVAGASVELLKNKSKGTSGTDGAYALTGPIGVIHGPAGSAAWNMSLEKGVLELIVAEASPVRIEIFTAGGNLLDRTTLDAASAGTYRFDLADRVRSGSLMIVKASIGKDSRTFPYFRMSEGAGTGGFSPVASARSALAKTSAVVDTLQVTAAGFTAKKIPITSYDTTVNVALDSAGDRWGGLKNPPGKSAGCGKAAGITNGKKTIQSNNASRSYIIDIPANYDMNKPYKFFYCSHWISSTAEAVQGQNYYFLKPLATSANEPAIFLAPQALPGNPNGTWNTQNNTDQILFDNILAYVKANLCIDTTRVFATGFSFGGMMTYSLSTNHQHAIRAAVGIAPANYNIYVPREAEKPHTPIAWMQTTGVGPNGDGTCPWVQGTSTTNGAKYIALEHAKDNGCDIPTGNNVPIWQSGAHLCYDFTGCKTGYPVKACTFGGGHTNIQSDPGSNVNWIPQESWKFFSQF